MATSPIPPSIATYHPYAAQTRSPAIPSPVGQFFTRVGESVSDWWRNIIGGWQGDVTGDGTYRVTEADWVNAPLQGRARVVDGDTVVVNGTPVRIGRIDAPEKGEIAYTADGRAYRAGDAATRTLQERAAGGRLYVTPTDIDVYGRIVGDVHRASRTGGGRSEPPPPEGTMSVPLPLYEYTPRQERPTGGVPPTRPAGGQRLAMGEDPYREQLQRVRQGIRAIVGSGAHPDTINNFLQSYVYPVYLAPLLQARQAWQERQWNMYDAAVKARAKASSGAAAQPKPTKGESVSYTDPVTGMSVTGRYYSDKGVVVWYQPGKPGNPETGEPATRGGVVMERVRPGRGL